MTQIADAFHAELEGTKARVLFDRLYSIRSTRSEDGVGSGGLESKAKYKTSQGTFLHSSAWNTYLLFHAVD